MTDHESSVHIRAIRQALADGNAAVMVGSGFSLNAEGGAQLATWGALCEELYRALNPEWSPKPDAPLPFSTSQVTQLGEQYARVLSQSALEDLLKRMIPDDKVQPGVLHRRLLQLPWTELLTTNYDTLLERAAESVVERGHFTVICREDIPRSKVLERRRIVKLHGSFPSQRPFVFTEEEYRKYPTEFAPFVNLVRQSMLENVLCLIGFSGDDPNFLAWIGWVRDMLDKHALPIYLFLNEAPSLGMRSLLAVRKVTPVILPGAKSSEPNDYAGRYAELFDQLSKPLAPNDSDWAKGASLGNSDYIEHENIEAKEARMLECAGNLHTLTKSYPDWLVAPKSVRQNFETLTLRPGIEALQYPNTYKAMEEILPARTVALLAMHIWNSDVLLAVLNDQIAEIGLRLLDLPFEVFQEETPHDCAVLAQLGINTATQYRQTVKRMGIGLLRWARERQVRQDFDRITSRMHFLFPDDAEVNDTLTHETVLLHLYQGERHAARDSLLQWRPAASTPYMSVRRGALLAEAGALDQGYDICLAGLQALRKSQKIRSDRARFLSEEAWGCHILALLQAAKDWNFWPRRDNPPTDSGEAAAFLEASRRLPQLDGGGHDVGRHLQDIIAELDADIPAPKVPAHFATGFEVGHYSRHDQILVGHLVTRRMQAAFAWLTTADRVGLPTRIGSSRFDTGTFVQAAWWTQYWETPRRLLGVATRLLDKEVLEPRDVSKPVHSTGWLSRNQVARLEFSVVLEVRERAIKLVERAMSEMTDLKELERFAKFHLELASRLSVRVVDDAELVRSVEWGVQIFSHPRVLQIPSAWAALSNFLLRNFETASLVYRRQLLLALTNLPDAPKEGYARGNAWFKPLALVAAQGVSGSDATIENRLQVTAATFLSKLEKLPTDADGNAVLWLWSWILTLEAGGALDAATKERMTAYASTLPSWPEIPGFSLFPAAGICSALPGACEKFRSWVLQQPLTNLRTPQAPQSDGRQRWQWSFPANQRFLEALQVSQRLALWPEAHSLQALAIIRNWWRGEGHILPGELEGRGEFEIQAVRGRFDLIDKVVAGASKAGDLAKLLRRDKLRSWIDEMIDVCDAHSILFIRIQLALAQSEGNEDAALKARKALVRMFTTARNDTDAFKAANMMGSLLSSGVELGDLILDTVVSILVARRSPTIVWALHVCRMAIIHTQKALTPARRALIDTALLNVSEEAVYGDRPAAASTNDDDVPVIRLYAAELAIALITAFPRQHFVGAKACIEFRANDPLPEIRHLSIPANALSKTKTYRGP
jgi:hypothetical protein